MLEANSGIRSVSAMDDTIDGHINFSLPAALPLLLTSHNPNKGNETDMEVGDTRVLTRRLPCRRSHARR